jgi:hypothetical protein
VPERAYEAQRIFKKMPALAKAGVESGFPSENAMRKKC